MGAASRRPKMRVRRVDVNHFARLIRDLPDDSTYNGKYSGVRLRWWAAEEGGYYYEGRTRREAVMAYERAGRR